MTKKWLIVFNLAIVTTVGCSKSETTSKVAAVGAATVAAALPSLGTTSTTAATTLPAEPKAPAAATGEANTASPVSPPVTPFSEMGDLFAPPKIVVPVVTPEPEPEPEPEPVAQPIVEAPKQQKALPPLRLVGFVEVEGLKALLSVEGKLKVVVIGDTQDGLEGLQIIAIEPPAVTLKHGEDGQEFQMNLYEQPWFHPAGAVTDDRKSFGGKPVFQKNQTPTTGVSLPGGLTNGPGTTPPGAPIPGGMSAPPVIPGFGGTIGPPPGAPGFNVNNMPGVPGPPADNRSKSSKKTSKSTKDSSSSSALGMPGLPGGPALPGTK